MENAHLASNFVITPALGVVFISPILSASLPNGGTCMQQLTFVLPGVDCLFISTILL